MNVYLSALVVCVLSVVIGGGLTKVLDRDSRWSWLGPAAGLAVLVCVAPIAVRLPGYSTVALGMLGALALASVPGLRGLDRSTVVTGGVVATLSLALASLPFLAAERVGVLGVLDNADLAGHLILADGLAHGDSSPPSPYAEASYPRGPHSLVAALTAMGVDAREAFLGLLLAVPVLTALTALALLRDLPRARAIAAATLCGLPYLGAAWLTQSAFKEPMMALLLLAFTVAVRERIDLDRRGGRTLVLPVLLAVAAVPTYGYAGPLWPLAVVAPLALVAVVRGRRAALRLGRRFLLYAAGALVLVLVIGLSDPERVRDSLDAAAAIGGDESRGGNILLPIRPFTVLGVWPAADFRDDSLPFAPVLVALSLVGAALAALWWVRRRESTVLAAVAGCFAVYVASRPTVTPYFDAKPLVIMAPLLMLFVLRALLEPNGPRGTIEHGPWALARRGARPAIALGFMVAAAWSTALILRSAPVATAARANELAELRPRLEGRRTLFLGQDDYVFWELRGARVATIDSYVGDSQVRFSVRSDNPLLPGEPVEFDSLDRGNLDRFEVIVSPRGAYASIPPRNWRPVATTPSFVMWERRGRTANREIVPGEAGGGATLDCDDATGGQIATRSGFAAVRERPVLGPASQWRSPGRRSAANPGELTPLEAGRTASQTLVLPPGRFQLSLQYVSPVALSVSAPGMKRRELPASLEGSTPHWPAGTLSGGGGSVPIEVRADDGSPVGHGTEALLGAIAAVRPEHPRTVPLRQACGRWTDWFTLDD